MPTPAQLIARTPFRGVTTAEIATAREGLDKRIEELSALTQDQVQRYASTMHSVEPIQSAIHQEAKSLQRNQRVNHLRLALDMLRMCMEMRAYLDTQECQQAAQAHEEKLAADRERRKTLRPVQPDPFAWADDACEYYGGGSVD